MSSASEAAGAIDALRQRAGELAGKVNSSKGQAEAMVGALEGIGAEDKSVQVKAVEGKLEAAEASRAGFEGTLAKAHFMMLSVMHGNMGPAVPGSGVIVPHTSVDADGAPTVGLDAIPPQLRQAPAPTGEDLLEPPRTRKAKSLFRDAIAKGDQVEDATKTLGQQFDSAWEAFYGEPSPAKAQQHSVSETTSLHGTISTEMPVPKVGAGGAVMAAFVTSVVVAKAVQPIVRQFERKFSREEKG